MTENEITQTVEQRIRERFNGVRMVGAGLMQVHGGNGNFSVLMSPPPFISAAPRNVYPGSGGPLYSILPGKDHGPAFIRFNYANAINNVLWALPQGLQSLAGGKKLYAFITLTLQTATFLSRGAHDGGEQRFSSVTVHAAELRLTPLSTVPEPVDGFAMLDETGGGGTYTIHALMSRFKEDGSDDPPDSDQFFTEEVAGNPFMSGVYDFLGQRPPFQPQLFQKFSAVLSPNS